MAQGRALSTDQRTRFLAHLAQTANVTASAEMIGIDRMTAYRHREKDPAFAEAWEQALEMATDVLEAEARRRALDGCPEYVTCKDGLVRDGLGQPVMQRRYSDTLMTLLLKAHRPEKYKDRAALEVTGDLATLMEEGRRRAAEKAKTRGEEP